MPGLGLGAHLAIGSTIAIEGEGGVDPNAITDELGNAITDELGNAITDE